VHEPFGYKEKSLVAPNLQWLLLLLLCIASGMAQPSLASPPPPSPDSAGLALLRELQDHELDEELGLAGQRGNLRDFCSPACQTCLVVCAVTCVLNKEPIACFANCTVKSSCFGKQVEALPLAA
jgi:hypothetical protein